jgi:hypothetical protein
VKVVKVAANDVFRMVYAGCGLDYRRPFVCDVRASKEYKKAHLSYAFNIAPSKNGKVLAVCTLLPPSTPFRCLNDPSPRHMEARGPGRLVRHVTGLQSERTSCCPAAKGASS